MTFRYQAQLES